MIRRIGSTACTTSHSETFGRASQRETTAQAALRCSRPAAETLEHLRQISGRNAVASAICCGQRPIRMGSQPDYGSVRTRSFD